MNSLETTPVCRLQSLREDRGLSQAELARRCGLTRQSVHVIESGSSIPNVLTAMKLADALECTVEELFPRPDDETVIDVVLPRRSQLVTPRIEVARVRERWLGFPSDEAKNLTSGFRAADALMRAEKPRAQAVPLKPKRELERNIVVVGCDPGLGIVRDHLGTIAKSGRMLWFSASSQESLKRLEEGQSHIAGIHFIGAQGDENLRRAKQLKLPQGGVLMRFAHWEMGWLVANGNPKNIRTVSDLARKDVRFVNREKGSGSRYLLDLLLSKAGVAPKSVPGYETTVGSHHEGGLCVGRDEADVAMGLRSVAVVHGLDFVPMAHVGFDLVIPSDLMEHPTVALLCESLQSNRLQRELQALPGYETTETGRILATLPAQ